ncbi:MAG: glycoside hydrolase family 127 protein [Victivallales bacterium]|nr:glycoside hydrolase family 127 protein [Victivallales bacterium]
MPLVKYSTPTDLKEARFTGGLLARRQQTALDTTIPATMAKTIETGRLDAFRLTWRPGQPKKPHVFWDSDTAKVLEGMAGALALRPDPALEAEYDRWVDLIVSAQQPDGYLNTHFTAVEPEKRFTNLHDWHELYCCGHLIEAAVAGYTLLGKRKLLDCLCRYADYLVSYFGPGKHRGWPGHEEIELALMKLYQVTGKAQYLELAQYFINDRGTEPHFYIEEEKTQAGGSWHRTQNQTHAPVRRQFTAEGHAVRAMYLFAGAADVAGATDDQELLQACEAVFENVRTRRMYITGGLGSCFAGERFTTDYDLSNGAMMYAESCASIALVFFCQRMLNLTGEEKYADVLERTLFNGVLAGISLSGDRFFYTNYLEVDENLCCYNSGSPVRKEWFDCSCCPTNFARFLTQMQQYVFSVGDTELRLHLPVDMEIRHQFANGMVARLAVTGGYPYHGKVSIAVLEDGEYTLSLRLPGWCRNAVVEVNGERVYAGTGGKYLPLTRKWSKGDCLTLELEMPGEFIRCNSKVTTNAGRVAVMRGPVVYCVESRGLSGEVRNFLVDTDRPPELAPAPEGLPSDAPALRLFGQLEQPDETEELYFVGRPRCAPCTALAIPYALWNNCGPTNMAVWLRTTGAGA